MYVHVYVNVLNYILLKYSTTGVLLLHRVMTADKILHHQDLFQLLFIIKFGKLEWIIGVYTCTCISII